MPAAGFLCLAYYGAVSVRLRRWDSTFSRFWLIMGILCLSLYAAASRIPGMADSKLWKLMRAAVVIFIVAELFIVLAMIPTKERGIPYIIVLGAQVKGTMITDSLRRRLKRSATYLSENPDTTVIVSGGQGPGEEITEAEAMAEYLEVWGIDRRRILLEDKSKSTEENLRYSAAYIPDMELPVGIVSNNFHMFRACCYARRTGYKNIRRLPAGCNALLFPNYMVREFFAVCKFFVTIK